jgi:hypothetical protein
MKARLYRLRKTATPFVYAVVFRGKQVGEIWRKKHDRSHMWGRADWECAAWLRGDDVLHNDDYVIRRGDAKRWILQHQTEVPT